MQATAGEDPRSGGYSRGRNDVRTLSFLVFVVALRILLWGQQVTLPHIQRKDPNPNLNPENSIDCETNPRKTKVILKYFYHKPREHNKY